MENSSRNFSEISISESSHRPFYWKTHPLKIMGTYSVFLILGRHTGRFTGKLIHSNFDWNLIGYVTCRDACSWKGQLERTRSWKVLSWKVWSWKVWLKLERAKRSWKEPSEVGKNRLKLERTDRSWKEPIEVGKFFFKLESFAEVGKFRCSWKVLTDVGKLSLKLESVTALNYGTKGWKWTVWKCQIGRSESVKVDGPNVLK